VRKAVFGSVLDFATNLENDAPDRPGPVAGMVGRRGMKERHPLDGLEEHRAYLVQQTLFEACRTPPTVPPEGLRAYLRRALRNNVLDALKRGGKAAPAAVEAERSSARVEDWLAAEHSSPSERAAREERLARLATALARLTEAQRTAVELKHLRGHSVAEIAALMGRTEAAVGGLLRHGIQALRDLLGEPN
jgi:RNA polymerase sigma factor (sigma-70 family)